MFYKKIQLTINSTHSSTPVMTRFFRFILPSLQNKICKQIYISRTKVKGPQIVYAREISIA